MYLKTQLAHTSYESYFSIFESIFRLPESVPMYYVPGNHDIPLGPNRLFSPQARDRYARHFSAPNKILEIANHSLILLDAVGLVEEDYRRYAAEMQFGEWDGIEGGVIEFVKGLGERELQVRANERLTHCAEPPAGPKILLSHIPLARPESASCGPFRESGRISKGAGPGYQNLLGSETSRFLLEALKPSIVFSGDDHDYCDLTHHNGVREITLKSFSSTTGIRRPGLQLLSLVPPDSAAPYTTQKTIADRPCFLPDQAGVYTWVYLPVAILTVLFLFVTNVRSAWRKWASSGNSIYGDLKSRVSPGMPSGDFPTSAGPRRASDRPAPLTLPSRKSSQHLNGLTMLTPSTSSFAARPHRLSSMVDVRSAYSAPVSPTASPRMNSYDEKDDDVESVLETPNISRRSSYIYMNGNHNVHNGHGDASSYHTSGPLTSEPPSYFLPVPPGAEPTSNGLGFGYATPSTGSSMGMRRASSTNLNPPASGSVSPAHGSSFTHLPNGVSRRVTMPRALTSASDWAAAAKAKEKSVFGVMVDSLPVPGSSRRGRAGATATFDAVRGFLRWTWKSRNGVVARSWKETLKVAWPAAIVWVVVNALFFLD